MEEKPKGIWKKSFTGRIAWVIWLAVCIFAIMLGSYIIALLDYSRPMSETLMAVAHFAGAFLTVCLIIIYLVWPLLRWLFWKHWRRTLFALACLATLIALFYAEENWRGKHGWENFKREWEARGEHFDFKSIIPPPVPDDQNFAMAPIIVESIEAGYGSNVTRQWYGKTLTDQERSNLVDRLQMDIARNDDWPLTHSTTNGIGNWQMAKTSDLKVWQNYYHTLAATTNEFPTAPQLQTPAQDVLLALSKYDPALEELRQASQRPYAQFPVYSNPDRPFDTLLPHLSMLKRCTQPLQLRAIAELQNNQSQAALDHVKLLLRLIESIRGEPFLISHLVRVAMLEYAVQPVYEGLAEHKWSDTQLAGLDAELAKLDFLVDYQQSMRGERVCAIATVDFLRRNSDWAIINRQDENMPIRNLGLLLAPRGWFFLNSLALAQMNQLVLLPLANVPDRIVSPDAVQRANSAETDLVKNGPRVAFIAKQIYPALSGTVRRFAFAQEAVDLARVAIALERYRLAHGEYPESLDALTPQFMAKIPHDIINGQPLKYHRTDNGQFVLYSVGWNETDDGGVVVFNTGKTTSVDISQGDWVWRYPAK